MKLELTTKQYRDLLEVVLIGNWIGGGLYDQGLYDKDDYEAIEDYLLSKAGDFDSSDLVEEYKGHLLPANKLDKRVEKLMAENEMADFWDVLERELGQRDFHETITAEEKKEMEENNGWYPDRIDSIYKKYATEFEKHGVERLRIMENKNTK